MTVFRITLEKFSASLVASGSPARWNSKDVRIIYTASTRALACLENVVHRNAIGLQQNFRILSIEIPDNILLTEIEQKSLTVDWHLFKNIPKTQAAGNDWIQKGATAVLRVPSAIIPNEFNYLLNPLHKNFAEIKLINTEVFEFDPRIKD